MKQARVPVYGTLGAYHLRPLRTFIGLAPLHPGAEPLEEHGNHASDEREAIQASLHHDFLTSVSWLPP